MIKDLPPEQREAFWQKPPPPAARRDSGPVTGCDGDHGPPRRRDRGGRIPGLAAGARPTPFQACTRCGAEAHFSYRDPSDALVWFCGDPSVSNMMGGRATIGES